MTRQMTRTGKEWTDDEMKELKHLINQNTPTPLIAWKMRRTEDGVRSKVFDEDLSLKPTNKSPYNRRK